MPPAFRHALYYAPRPASLLARLGARWLGRDAVTGAETEQPAVGGISAGDFAALTRGARRYGFHGTLKAPIALADGTDEAALDDALDAFAATRAPAVIAGLRLGRLGAFLALVPDAPSPELERLAADLVRAFDHFRRPPDEAELGRRRRAGLSPRQEELLAAFGYPYVLEQFRFHMTLTDALTPEMLDAAEEAASTFFAPALGRPVTVDAIAHFVEPEGGGPFLVRRFVPLGGPLAARRQGTEPGRFGDER